MDQRAVRDQRYADCNVKRVEPIKQEEPAPVRGGRQSVENHKEQDQPEDRVDDFDGELGRREKQWEQ